MRVMAPQSSGLCARHLSLFLSCWVLSEVILLSSTWVERENEGREWFLGLPKVAEGNWPSYLGFLTQLTILTHHLFLPSLLLPVCLSFHFHMFPFSNFLSNLSPLPFCKIFPHVASLKLPVVGKGRGLCPVARAAQAPGASADSSQWSSVLWSLQPSAQVQVLVPPAQLIPVPMACRAQPERLLQC